MKDTFALDQYDYTVCPPEWGMADECAIFYRMYYIQGGEAYFKHQGETIRFQKDHFYILPVMSPYTMWQNVEDPLEVLWFHVEMQTEIFRGFGEVPICQDSEMYHLLKAIQRMNEVPGRFEDIRRVFAIVLQLLHQELPFQQIGSTRMKKVLKYVEENLDHSLSVRELADYVGMERSYFSRKFKSCFQLTPQQYVFAKKMGVAAKLLNQGATIYEAAAGAGYLDEKSFSRAFKGYMEISPGQYRKSHIVQP